MSAQCEHATILFGPIVSAPEEPPWRCIQCNAQFVPVESMQQMAEDFDRQMDLALSVAASTAARILSDVVRSLKGDEDKAETPAKKNPDPFFFGNETAKYPE